MSDGKRLLESLIEEESWTKIYKRAYEEGYQQGYDEGYQKGYIEGYHEVFVEFVGARFPELKVLAIQQVAHVKDTVLVVHFIVKISFASDAKEAAGMLLDLPTEAQEQV